MPYRYNYYMFKSKAGEENVTRSDKINLEQSGELTLRIFSDKSILEIYVNDIISISRRIFPKRPDSVGTVLFADGGEAYFQAVTF